jgi:hypothetical protein
VGAIFLPCSSPDILLFSVSIESISGICGSSAAGLRSGDVQMNAGAHRPRQQRAVRKNSLHLGCRLALFVLLAAASAARAAGDEKKEYDSYKVRLSPFWFYAQPSGHFTSSGRTGSLDLHGDIGFNSYTSFLGYADWKFTHKNHFYFYVTRFDRSKTVLLNRPVTFQGQTFNAGDTATGSLRSLIYSPGYQYDFIRRKQGSLGLQFQVNIIDLKGGLSAKAQVSNGVPRSAALSSGSLRVPLPVGGPKVRLCPIPNSNRFFVDANLLGMYFFGYGDYISSLGTLGLTLTKNLSLRGGYTVASRFNVNTKTDQLGVTLNEHGAVAGVEVSF